MKKMQTRIRKADQAAATRSLLVTTARKLFGERGYAGVSIDEIAQRAGVTTGGLYHHFSDKRDIFKVVYEEIESDLATKIIEGIQARYGPRSNAWLAVRAGGQAFLDACLDPAIQHVVLLDADSVLGWDARRDIAEYGLRLIRQGLQLAIDEGFIEPQPVEPLAHILRAALTEAALLLTRSGDQASARVEIGEAVDRLIDGLRSPKG